MCAFFWRFGCGVHTVAWLCGKATLVGFVLLSFGFFLFYGEAEAGRSAYCCGGCALRLALTSKEWRCPTISS
uniref:Uncharacterized protein n=1 Tax=Physcomitrium patens TaxID=3218 RepID=A0A2K1LAL4_PHYPA|nr:hypothetical protein PHYPA_001494 [Physcomitrium patens]